MTLRVRALLVAALLAALVVPGLLLTGCTEGAGVPKQVRLPGVVQVGESTDRKSVAFGGRTIDGGIFRASDARATPSS